MRTRIDLLVAGFVSVNSFLYGIFAVSGCANWQRSSQSGYASGDDSGRPARTLRASGSPHLERSDDEESDMTQIQRKESALRTTFEVEQYAKIVPYFASERERLEFLNLKSFEQKQRWLNENHFADRPTHLENEMRPLIESQDIKLGMPYVLVKKSWGDPDFVEASGNPSFHNERWRYNRYVSTPSGYKAEKKLVYFEGGRVAGWEVD